MATTLDTTAVRRPAGCKSSPDMDAVLDQVVYGMAALLVRRHLQEVEECLAATSLAARSANVQAAVAMLLRISDLLKAESASLAGAEGNWG